MNIKDLRKNSKKFWNRFWFLLWKDDSFKGWVFSVIIIFIFIKFIFFPALSFVTGTSLPLAIVESCSMYHKGNLFSDFETWWENHESKYSEFEIEKKDFDRWFNFDNGFNKGDILFVIEAKPKNLEEGDVIIFNGGSNYPVIHRIVEINEEKENRVFSTMGDNNNGQLSFEKSISEDQLVGKAIVKVAPYLGWVKLIFYEGMKPQSERGFCNER